ncbi:MFS transporter [Paenibacillus chibensis]|uniref:MFS transporter n=1 Tax=Paenibacillus chibensis TaxID=59846 RepID=UPI000FDC33EE|nr:MFS transporter [Paenibacillus chibensis]MEC0372208.1 MFS transporter [Paenibacillus chibensis]
MATWFLIIIYLSFISLGIPDALLGSAWPVMHRDIGASFGSAGLISMIVSVGTIVSSLASGSIIKRLGTGKITLISCCLTAAALLGFSAAPSLAWLAVLAIPLGIGAGAVDSALNHYVASNYKAHHMSWLHCFWGLGAMMGPMIMSYFIASRNSWRDGYSTVSMIQWGLVIILLVTLPLWSRVAKLHQASSEQKKRLVEYQNVEENGNDRLYQTDAKRRHPIHIPGVKFTLAAFLCYCGVEATVGLWGASYLVGAREITADTAASWVSLYYGGITLGRLITGFVTLKMNNRLLILIGQMTAIAGGIVLLLPLPDVCALIGMILIGLGLAPIYPGLIHETPARFGQENSARLIGYQMAVAYTGTTLLPPLFGLIASQVNVSLLPVMVLIFLILMLMSSEQVNRILKPRENEGSI